MNNDLIKKLMEEQSLTMVEALVLEQQLESGDQVRLSEAISHLPDAEVSLAWRSELNQRLQALAPVESKKKFSFKWVYSSAAVAATIAVVAFFAMKSNDTLERPAPIVSQNEKVDVESYGVKSYEIDQLDINNNFHVPVKLAQSSDEFMSQY